MDEPDELFLLVVLSFCSSRRVISAFAWSSVISAASFSYAPDVKAATEKWLFEKGKEPIDDEHNWAEPILLLVVLLTVLIRETVAAGSGAGPFGSRRGKGCWSLRASEAIESRTPPSLLVEQDMGGVIGIVIALLNAKGRGIFGSEGD
jgi:hypothetical protein